MFIIHTRVASFLFPREVPSNSPFECKVTEAVSGHSANFLLFSKRRATGPSYGKFIHMPHLRALRDCSLVSTAAVEQKVGGVSETTSITVCEFLSDAPFFGLSLCTEFQLANCACASGWSCLMNLDLQESKFTFWLFQSCWPCTL